jgi:hypothetical protein
MAVIRGNFPHDCLANVEPLPVTTADIYSNLEVKKHAQIFSKARQWDLIL